MDAHSLVVKKSMIKVPQFIYHYLNNLFLSLLSFHAHKLSK